ncbi:MAG: DNA repair ATPase [Acidimicrobiales bacterium]
MPQSDDPADPVTPGGEAGASAPEPVAEASDEGDGAGVVVSAASVPRGTGTYELLRSRLAEQARDLAARANRLNEARLAAFGTSEMALVGRARIRTENNCVPRDAVTVGDLLLFGYNVFIGLRTETKVADVLGLYRLRRPAGGNGRGEDFELHPVAADDPANFLSDARFAADFGELFRYYKNTKLVQLRRVEGRLLAVFQTGRAVGDLKVFRWAVGPDGAVRYIDDRGEREHVFPPAHDFEWTETTRDQHVGGRFPHVNVGDEVFVETTRGDLTIKVEDNTETGEGIYSEPVEQPTQSLADADIAFADVGGVLLLRVRPYKERAWRHLVFNRRTRQVDRVDAIGWACQQLPEDHGLIFPGGYYLATGAQKTFEGVASESMIFVEARRSPNGEDVLYVFHERVEGRTNLLPYNLITKQVAQQVVCNGYALYDDGTLVLFRAENGEASRIHPMQIWRTPFTSDEHAVEAGQEAGSSFLHVVGNAELVRAISDAYSIERLVADQAPSMASYEELVARAERFGDAHHWLDDPQVGELGSPLRELHATAELVIDEFEKVDALRREAVEATEAAETDFASLRRQLGGAERSDVQSFVEGLGRLRSQRGRLVSLRDMRYADLERITAVETRVAEAFDALAGEMVEFVLADGAFAPYLTRVADLQAAAEAAGTASLVMAAVADLTVVAEQMALLTEVVEGLRIDDPTERTRVLQAVSEVLAAVNRARAVAEGWRRQLATSESAAEFAAQMALLTEAVSTGLALAGSPDDCDSQLSQLLARLEGLESRFGNVEAHLDALATRRDDVYEAFSSRKQTLLDERQRQADRLMANGERVLETIARRVAQLGSLDEVNAYFVADPMVDRLRDIVDRLRTVADGVRADELEGRLVAARQEAGRTLRDRHDLFEDGAEVIRLGDHRFTVNTQPVDLTLVPREGRLDLAVTGTDFRQRLDDDPASREALAGTEPYWGQALVSETGEVYRAEFLATAMLTDAERGEAGLTIDALAAAAAPAAAAGAGGQLELVQRYAADRYDEGYERGVHDHDAALILHQLVLAYQGAELLRWPPRPRALACVFWGLCADEPLRVEWQHRARSLARLRASFGSTAAIEQFQAEMATGLTRFLTDPAAKSGEGPPDSGRSSPSFERPGSVVAGGIEVHPDDARAAAAYLFEELGQPTLSFATSGQAVRLRDALWSHLRATRQRRAFTADLAALGSLDARWQLVEAWLRGLVDASDDPEVTALAPDVDEATVLILTEGSTLPRTTSSALRTVTVSGLVAQHPRIEGGNLALRLDEILDRTSRFRHGRVPGFRRWVQARERVLDDARRRLRIGELRPKVMSAFVRNHLVDQVYLPLVGANLARQLGTVGAGRRSDQMGLLLLISPPGYGKTTLMEYLASRLGLVFVKVNGPALGNGVTSVDPAEAPNATARQEVEKVSFALEMGNNVLLYLDDIQHTSPELLQKFISLCDAQRRMEAVWRGRTRTYDLRGKRFAVCMAGNPYTESGKRFRVPDMLANRADVYNLGDVLTGREDLFALSYVENALTANPVLAPLAGRDLDDVPLLLRMVGGDDIPADRLGHHYSSVELGDVLSVLGTLRSIQQVVTTVNDAYIASASQDDAYRSEPPFLLQGSYRNMNKLVERVVPGMTTAEVEALVDDHYRSEAQTLTTGAEHNLLKLAELRGRQSGQDAERWEQVKRSFTRVQALGRDDDPMTRVAGQLGLIGDRLGDLRDALSTDDDARSGGDQR